MKFGLYGINIDACADPATAVRVAVAAEAAGFESLWTAEHIVLPDPCPDWLPMSASDPFLNPSTALAYIAAHTKSIRLATGIVLLPQHNPLVLAKEFASLDVVSGGRLIFGLGTGYLPEEYAALGIPFEERGARADEGIAVLRDLWTSPKPRFEGRFYRYADIDAHPRPLQRPHPPIIVGGMSMPAFRRAVAHGNGWYGFGLDPDATANCLAGLRAAENKITRSDSLGPLEITVTPAAEVDAELLEKYSSLGVHRLVLRAPGTDADAILDFIARTAQSIAA